MYRYHQKPICFSEEFLCEVVEISQNRIGRSVLESGEIVTVTKDLTARTLQTTEKYRDFKAAGTKGITECEIAGLILPLLADHVLREANHYLRLLETECEEQIHKKV